MELQSALSALSAGGEEGGGEEEGSCGAQEGPAAEGFSPTPEAEGGDKEKAGETIRGSNRRLERP